MNTPFRLLCCWILALLVACGGTPVQPPDDHEHAEDTHAHDDDEHGQLHLSAAQIRAAGIEIAPVMTGSGGALTVPALLIADPARSARISARVQGRIQQVSAGLGMPVKAGAVLAVLDSAEAAELGAELQAAQQQAGLARANLEREERLFAEQVSPEVDVLAARTAAAEAEISACNWHASGWAAAARRRALRG